MSTTVTADGSWSAPPSTDAVPFRGTLPATVEELEVVYIAGKAPTVVFKTVPDPPPPRRTRLTESPVNLWIASSMSGAGTAARRPGNNPDAR